MVSAACSSRSAATSICGLKVCSSQFVSGESMAKANWVDVTFAGHSEREYTSILSCILKYPVLGLIEPSGRCHT